MCIYICVCVYKSLETWDESLLLLWHWSSHIQWRESLLLGQRSTCRFGFSLLLLRSSHPFWFWSCCGLAEWNRNAPERQLDSVWQLGSTPCHAFRTHLPPTCWTCGCSWWGNLICDTALWCLGAHRLVERDKTRGFGSLHYIILISIYFILFLKEGNIVLNMKLFDPPDSAGASQYYPFQPAELCSQKNSGARLLTSASMTPSHSFAVSYSASCHCSFILRWLDELGFTVYNAYNCIIIGSCFGLKPVEAARSQVIQLGTAWGTLRGGSAMGIMLFLMQTCRRHRGIVASHSYRPAILTMLAICQDTEHDLQWNLTGSCWRGAWKRERCDNLVTSTGVTLTWRIRIFQTLIWLYNYIYIHIFLFFYLTIYLSIYLSVYLSVCLSVYLSAF